MKKFCVYQRYMLRPLIYLTAFRLMVALILLLAIACFCILRRSAEKNISEKV